TLIKQKRGTCTNFSILFVAMCRAMGIPARLVRDNSISSVTHAWSEFYIEGRGWVHVDPTAGYFNYPQAYLLEWGYRYRLVKAFSPLRGWIDITPSYVADYGTVAGVVELDGEPVDGAVVSVYYPENLRVLLTVETGGDGSFEFTVAEGTYILEVSYRGIVRTLTVSVEAGKAIKVEINLG
ncbi:carboxypeptidase regulatory-like domain-containing protein, partial [Candidatus Bathyarchaeota archaeon]|nr:carboxypeptidase regulatory-like domain-containing protein [Candidatus Bathyarchaeota archaeon]